MIIPPLPSKRRADFLIKIDKFTGGTATLINPARLDPRFATESINLIQDQDGIWRTRPGINYFGSPLPTNDPIDGASEYVRQDGVRELIVIAGGKAYKSTTGASWSQITGATFTKGVRPTFLQINNVLYISNGVDNLVRYNGTQLLKYTPINPPTGLNVTRGAGLTSGSYNNFYTVVAINEVGFTTPCNSFQITSNIHRNYWDAKASNPQVMNLTWNAVTGALGYQIYWGELAGNEVLIGTSTTNSFQDRGEAETPKNEYVETPNDNTTGAPKFRSMEISDNIIWATGDPANKWRVYWSGSGQDIGRFSPFFGGGWVDLEEGSKNIPLSVVHYRTGKGDPIITALCSSNDGKGIIFQIALTPMTVAQTTIIVPAVLKVTGSIGTDSPFGVVKVGDNIFFINKRGVFALRNKEQMFNVLSTDNLIQPVRNKWDSINQNKISEAIAYFKYPRVYFSLPAGDKNDTTVIFDMERSNWSWGWTVGFNQLLEFTDNDGITHFLGVLSGGNRLVEISDNYRGDFGMPFYQSYISPIIKMDNDLTVLAKIKEVIFELGNFSGSAIVEVLGIQKNREGLVQSTAAKEIASTIGLSGWGDDFFSDFLFSDTNDTPSIYSASTRKKRLKVNKKLYGIQFRVYTTKQAYFELLSIQATGSKMKAKAPSNWN